MVERRESEGNEGKRNFVDGREPLSGTSPFQIGESFAGWPLIATLRGCEGVGQ